MAVSLSAVYPLDGETPIDYLKRQIAIARSYNKELLARLSNGLVEIEERAIDPGLVPEDANSTINALRESNLEQACQAEIQLPTTMGKSQVMDEMVAAHALVHFNFVATDFFGLVAELRSLHEGQRKLLLRQKALLREGGDIIDSLNDKLRKGVAARSVMETKLSKRILELEQVVADQTASLAGTTKHIKDLTQASATAPLASHLPLNSPETRQLSDLRQKVAIQGDQVEKLTAALTGQKEELETAVTKEGRMSAKIKELKEHISKAKNTEARLSVTIEAQKKEASMRGERANAERTRSKKDMQNLQHQIETLNLEKTNLQTETGALRNQILDVERGAELDQQSCLRSCALLKQGLKDARQTIEEARQANRIMEQRQRRFKQDEEDSRASGGLALYGDLKTPAPESDDPPLEAQYLQDEVDGLRRSNQELEKKVKKLQARDQASRRVQNEVLSCASDFKKTERPSRHQLSRWLHAFERVYHSEFDAEE